MKKVRFVVGLLIMATFGRTQTGINGNAFITLVDSGVTCQGYARAVDVFVDITGLNGQNGAAAGLNGYVLTLSVDRPDVFASATAGTVPDVAWQLMTTRRELISTEITLVGWSTDTNAPNTRYRVAQVLFSGQRGPLNIQLDHRSSSLGSRVVNGDGPGPISIFTGAVQGSFTIPLTFDLSLGHGMAVWHMTSGLYDFVPPLDQVDVNDLIRLMNCGA